MDKNEFSIVLPSNSSMKYFPNNVTTNYSTRLPKEVELYGKWTVGISEIHVPCTTLHLRREDTKLSDSPEHYFQHGIYDSMYSFVTALNDSLFLYHKKEVCEKVFYDEKGGFITVKEIRKSEWQKKCKPVVLSDAVKRILGFADGFSLVPVPEEEKNVYRNVMVVGNHPASLARAIPDQLFVYSNLCEPSIVGDTHASLLRIVNINAKKFNFGSTIVKTFAPIHYVPLLNNRFQTIDIDIRDQFGKPIPFEFGTLTVALHFKREY